MSPEEKLELILVRGLIDKHLGPKGLEMFENILTTKESRGVSLDTCFFETFVGMEVVGKINQAGSTLQALLEDAGFDIQGQKEPEGYDSPTVLWKLEWDEPGEEDKKDPPKDPPPGSTIH